MANEGLEEEHFSKVFSLNPKNKALATQSQIRRKTYVKKKN